MIRISDYLAANFGVIGNFDMVANDGASQALVASILLLAAESDRAIAPAESANLQTLIGDGFASSDPQTVERSAEPSQRIPDLSNPDDIISHANRVLGLPQKEELMLMVLQIIAADERKAPGELEFLDQLVIGLDISSDVMEGVYTRYFEGKK